MKKATLIALNLILLLHRMDTVCFLFKETSLIFHRQYLLFLLVTETLVLLAVLWRVPVRE